MTCILQPVKIRQKAKQARQDQGGSRVTFLPEDKAEQRWPSDTAVASKRSFIDYVEETYNLM